MSMSRATRPGEAMFDWREALGALGLVAYVVAVAVILTALWTAVKVLSG